jgi:hypothetical protein
LHGFQGDDLSGQDEEKTGGMLRLMVHHKSDSNGCELSVGDFILVSGIEREERTHIGKARQVVCFFFVTVSPVVSLL